MTHLPDFSDDPVTERLACYFEELYAYLIEEGVPEDCLPSPWHVLRRVTQAIDHAKLRGWLDAYVAVEAQDEDETDDPETDSKNPASHRGSPGSARPDVRRRPSYLKALDPSKNVAQENVGAPLEGEDAPVKGSVPLGRQAPQGPHTPPDD